MDGRSIVTSSREYAENIIDTVREPLIVLDQDLRVITANHNFYETFKVTAEETIGNFIYDVGNRQWDIPQLRVLIEEILPRNTVINGYEVEHDFATIGRRTMLLNARQIEQTPGKERIILLAIEDISERRLLEDFMSESETRYRRIFETARDGIVLLEKKEGHIVHANLAVEKMFGYSEADFVGKKLSDIGIPLDMNNFSVILEDLNECGILNYEDVPVKTRSGQHVDTDIYMVDKAQLVQCNIRDVSERKLAQQDLQMALVRAHEAATRAEAVMASMGEGLSIQNSDYIITYQNKVLQDLIGDHVGENYFTAYEKNEQAGGKSPLKSAFNDGRVHRGTTTVAVGNETRYHEITASPLRDIDGNIVAVVEVIRDVSEQKKLEAQLFHSQKMEAVGTLAGGIAHDFNNILNVIMGYGSMIMDKLEDSSPSKKHMKEVLIAADMAANLTKRLLFFSRKQVAEMKPANINDLILGLKQMLLRVIRENIDFSLNLAEIPLILQADSGQIEQVLINLVSNAKDVMPEGGRLTIGTRLEVLNDEYAAAYGCGKPGRYVLLTVADSGQGIDAEIQKRIFEPFFTTKGVGKGTGLGLAISYGIIKQHGGNIIVHSEPGHGTVFKIYLPLSEKEASPGIKTENDPLVMGGSETILVAEDNISLMQLSRIILESFGYRVITAKDGEEAIAKFTQNRERISLLLLDMIMPKKNGNEVFELIHNVCPGMKVIFTSGYSMDTLATDELTAAGYDYINKPFKSSDLLTKVRAVLDR
ncbi:MAG: PAS domain S-box protein [Desulfuromonadales bacterium]